MTKALVILAAGLFAVYLGFKSLSGYEAETTHLFGGDFVTLTCDGDGTPISGIGWQSTSAERACANELSDQQGRAKWWLLIGAAGVIYGYRELRKARASSSA
jgi:hypothetical protein